MDNPAQEWGTDDIMPRDLKSAILRELRQEHYEKLNKLKREAANSGLPPITNQKQRQC